MGNNLSKVQLTVEQIIDRHLEAVADMVSTKRRLCRPSTPKIAKFNSLNTKNPFLEKTLLQLKREQIEKRLRKIGVISHNQ